MKYGPIMPCFVGIPVSGNVQFYSGIHGKDKRGNQNPIFIGFLFYIDDTKYTISKETRR